MLTYGIVVPALLLLATFSLEYVAFLTSHMIDSRSLASLHVGIFLRCSYPITIGNRNEFRCLWWSDDTFNHDETSLKIVTILTFITLFLVGSSVIVLFGGYFYTNLENKRFRIGMAASNLLNFTLILLILLIYAFAYARETRIIPGGTSSLVFSWSFYLLVGALISSLLSAIFYLYNPFKNKSLSSSRQMQSFKY